MIQDFEWIYKLYNYVLYIIRRTYCFVQLDLEVQ